MPLLMVDVVLLTLLQGSLHVGLCRRTNSDEPFHDKWTLPGGMVRPAVDKDAEATARRVLKDKASVTSPYLEQLATFSGAKRDPRGWSASIAHYALVLNQVAPEATDNFRWVPLEDIRALPFDHLKILRTAVGRLRSKTRYSSLPLHLAPDEFTMTELRAIYEQVMGGSIPARTFERYILQLDVLVDTGQLRSSGGKPGKVFRKRPSAKLAELDAGLTARAN